MHSTRIRLSSQCRTTWMEYEQGRMDEILARVEEIAMSTEPPCPPDTPPTWACAPTVDIRSPVL